MSKIILFSQPTVEVLDKIIPEIFSSDSNKYTVGYMPSNGATIKKNHLEFWKDITNQFSDMFVVINNSLTDEAAVQEIQKLHQCDVLIITGGNTYTLLRNLKRSGLDQAIQKFAVKEECTIVGFSAGAHILTPRIDIVGEIPGYDENVVGLQDLSALGLVEFELTSHYTSEQDRYLDRYEEQNPGVEVRRLSDSDYLILNSTS